MGRVRRWTVALTVVSVAAGVSPSAAPARVEDGGRSITYVGVVHGATDVAALGIGTSGYWFPHFGATEPADGRPTGEGAVDELPPWVTPFNHWSSLTDVGCDVDALASGCIPTFFFRTFSQDGPARSAGGQPTWSVMTLPDGRTGRSGAIVDPHTRGNSNNTINRIQVTDGVPPSFLLHVVTDNTAREHDPTNLLQARGNIGPLDADLQVEADRFPRTADLTFDGIPDVYTFRFDGFRPGDFLKLRLNGDPHPATGASFGGLLFDDAAGGR